MRGSRASGRRPLFAHSERSAGSGSSGTLRINSGTPLDRVRAFCLALPETTEQAFGRHTTPTFRVRDKIFAMLSDDHRGDGRVVLVCKAPPGAQAVLVGADPARYFSPMYVGPKGWIGVRLGGKPNWEAIAGHLEESYRMTAPRRLSAQRR